jgi:hypothetical protein
VRSVEGVLLTLRAFEKVKLGDFKLKISAPSTAGICLSRTEAA